jgi:hypothetical protein
METVFGAWANAAPGAGSEDWARAWALAGAAPHTAMPHTAMPPRMMATSAFKKAGKTGKTGRVGSAWRTRI